MRIFTTLFVFMLLFAFSEANSQATWPDYAGKAACFGCHISTKPIDLAEFNKSGHPWKIQKIDPTKIGIDRVYRPFPTGTNEYGVPLAPEALALGYHYDDLYQDSSVSYLIGGFGWKARWMNKNGYIFEGTKAQFNLGTTLPGNPKTFSAYNALNVANQAFALRGGTGLLYNCGGCHTTGWKKYDAVNSPYRFEDKPGFDGTFFEFGVQCEGCHGPSKAHTTNPSLKPPKNGFDGCKACHARGLGVRIPVKSGGQFLDHREQYDQMIFTKHRRTASMTCVTCHDPHKSTIYDRGGLKSIAKGCSCHPGKAINIIKDGVALQHNQCKDCHMPYIGNTAVIQNNNRGDQASHMWKIKTTTDNKFTGMWTADSLNVKIPTDSIVAHTLDFACLGCHTGKDLTWASGHATGMHGKTIIVTNVGNDKNIPSAWYLNQNYPNPFNPSTMIKFGLPTESNVKITIFDVDGRLLNTIVDGKYAAGEHQVTWNGSDADGNLVATGVYLYRLDTDEYNQTRKMLLMK